MVEDTISEYITMRTVEADKIARTNTYGIADANKVGTTEKEEYIKAAVCCDCLVVLIDTLPAHIVDESTSKTTDTRYREQLKRFEERADRFRRLIAEPNAAAFDTDSTNTRQQA